MYIRIVIHTKSQVVILLNAIKSWKIIANLESVRVCVCVNAYTPFELRVDGNVWMHSIQQIPPLCFACCVAFYLGSVSARQWGGGSNIVTHRRNHRRTFVWKSIFRFGGQWHEISKSNAKPILASTVCVFGCVPIPTAATITNSRLWRSTFDSCVCFRFVSSQFVDCSARHGWESFSVLMDPSGYILLSVLSQQ